MNSRESDELESEIERGPNGFPYVGEVRLSGWENGEYHLKIFREDGEKVVANLREDDLRAFKEMAEEVLANDE